MDENEQDEILEEALEDETAEEEEEKPKETPKEAPEAKLARIEREAKQLRKKLGINEEKPAKESKPTPKEESNSSGLGYGEKAYLASYGVKGAEELALVQEYLDNGKSLDDIPENKHFLNDLKDLREEKATKDAIPTSTKRSGVKTSDNVDYWVNKPFSEVPENMRRAVLDAKVKTEKDTSMFSATPIVHG